MSNVGTITDGDLDSLIGLVKRRLGVLGVDLDSDLAQDLADDLEVFLLDKCEVEVSSGDATVVDDTPSKAPQLEASAVSTLADQAVADMGDIFFDPDPSCGEACIPAGIAYNACSEAIQSALRAAGVTIAGTVTCAPDSVDQLSA
jgi:hypothetical protein